MTQKVTSSGFWFCNESCCCKASLKGKLYLPANSSTYWKIPVTFPMTFLMSIHLEDVCSLHLINFILGRQTGPDDKSRTVREEILRKLSFMPQIQWKKAPHLVLFFHCK